MKYRPFILLLGGYLAVTSALPVRAADGPATPAVRQNSGSISGRVQNVVTGRYLNNARVTVKETGVVALTDESGSFHLVDVPSGPAALEVFYTGLDLQTLSVSVSAGRSVAQDVGLTSATRYGKNGDAVMLDSFVVSTALETDAAAIAINERRFASNPKDVVSTEAFGDITGGNIGEFMKFLPGVLPTDGGGSEVNNLSLRGLPANLTVFTTDGAQFASANTGGDTRTADVSNISISNVSRVEVIKSPLPSTRADSMAGTVNLISKTAFESNRAEFRYRVNFTTNDQFFSLKKTPDTLEERTYKLYPGFDFNYTNPVTKNFGFVVSGLHTQFLTASHAFFRNYNATAANTGTSFAKPFLGDIINRGPSLNTTQRDSISVKADWRITPHRVLSAGIQTSYNTAASANIQFAQNAGANPTPTVAGGAPFSYGPDFTHGATGRGSATIPSTLQGTQGASTGGNLSYKFNDGKWKLDANVSRSAARKSLRQEKHGYFNSLTVGMKAPVRVSFTDIGPDSMTIRAFDNANQEVDIYDINNYAVTAAALAPRDVRDEVKAYNLDLRRQFDQWRFPFSLQIGGLFQEQDRDSQRQSFGYTYRPPNGDTSAAPYVPKIFRAEVYNNPGLYYNQGEKLAPMVSPLVAYRAYQANPDLFFQTPAQVLASEQAERVNSFHIREAVTAAYIQGETRFFHDRLNILTGVRFEKTDNQGLSALQDPSAVFQRNADGSFAHNAAGARVRKVEAGLAGSIEEMRVIYTQRGNYASRSRHGYFPSLHFRYNAMDNLIVRASYAKSYGRPDFTNIIANTVTNEADVSDPSQIQGTLTTSNPGLKPWYADNFDLSAEYYTKQGGVFSAGVYQKDITDFFGTFSRVATPADLALLGFDSRYENWLITTKINAGDARITGAEFSINQSLEPLGGWGRYFKVFVNGTKLKVTSKSNLSDFGYFLPLSANWGFTVNKKPFTFRANWNYRGWLKASPQPTRGPDGFYYLKPAGPTLDASLDIQVRKSVFVFLNGKNIFGTPIHHAMWGAETPDYAQRYSTQNFGVILTAGLRGSF